MTKTFATLATNASKVVELGFVPDRVEIRNLTNFYKMNWSKAQSDMYRVLSLTAAQTPGVTAALDIVAVITPGSGITNVELAFADLGTTGATAAALSGLGTEASPLRVTVSISDAHSGNDEILSVLEAISNASIAFRVNGTNATDASDCTAWAFIDTVRSFSVAQCGLVTSPTDGAVVDLIAATGAITNTGIKAIDGTDKVNNVTSSYGFVIGACANINDTTTEILEVTAYRSDL